VSAESECDVTIILAPDIQAIGICETLRIAIGRTHHGNDSLSLANSPAVNFGVFRG
jgi:hypothetical protein